MGMVKLRHLYFQAIQLVVVNCCVFSDVKLLLILTFYVYFCIPSYYPEPTHT